MGLTAREVMSTRFFTLKPETSIGDAVHVFQEAHRESGRTVFGLMVTSDEGKLVGMLVHAGERLREGQPVAWLRVA